MARVLILRSAGTNCDEETGYAFRLAGAEVESVHVGELLRRERRLDEFDILAFPGGFSYGDDLGAGTVLAARLESRLADDIAAFVADGKLVIGICNGFQVLVRLGVLPGWGGEKVASLVENTSGRFEDRWVRLRVDAPASPFLGFATAEERRFVRYPIAHKEGRFVVRDPEMVARLRDAGQIAFTYASRDADEAAGGRFPDNPNGSVEDIAGIVDPTGNVLGLMPHPERFLSTLQDPVWTRGRVDPDGDPRAVLAGGDGFAIFRAAVAHVDERLAAR